VLSNTEIRPVSIVIVLSPLLTSSSSKILVDDVVSVVIAMVVELGVIEGAVTWM